MRRVNLRNILSIVPASGFVEVVQDAKGWDNAKTQYLAMSELGSAAVAAQATVDNSIAGNSEDLIATPTGDTTGEISPLAEHVSATSVDADQILSLPVAIAGKRIRITGPVNGCELRSIVPGDKINTVVVGITNEAALIAGTLYTLEYDGVDNWIMTGVTAAGVVEIPVTPDTI